MGAGGRKRRAVPADLKRARKRFAAWRRGRSAGERIPEPLWKLAMKLAGIYGVHRTKAALGLDYYSLKKRVERAKAAATSAPPSFVELPQPAAFSGGECVIELDDGAGATMRVRMTGCSVPDLIALSRGFWSGE